MTNKYLEKISAVDWKDVARSGHTALTGLAAGVALSGHMLNKHHLEEIKATSSLPPPEFLNEEGLRKYYSQEKAARVFPQVAKAVSHAAGDSLHSPLLGSLDRIGFQDRKKAILHSVLQKRIENRQFWANEKMAEIEIQKSHQGLLHDQLGIPQGEKIPVDRLQELLKSEDPAVRRRAQFAINARKWKHG
jgi:hypothetical protein